MYTIICLAYPLSALAGSSIMDALLTSQGLGTVMSVCGALTSIGLLLS